MPSNIGTNLKTSLKMGPYLLKWIFQRLKIGPGEYSYHQRSAAMAMTFILIFVVPASIWLLSLMLPWAWVTWVLSLWAVYGLYRVMGLYASMVGLPHKLDESCLLVRYSFLVSGCIPYDSIESVELSREGWGQGGDGLKLDLEEPIAYLNVGSANSIKIGLRNPVTLEAEGMPTPPVSTIFIHADHPDLLVDALQQRLGMAPEV
ncbi:hypothetical protein ABFB09_03370 [Dehalogenimonas sp. THU2]|uniref:hypothetical protein n=1 Tax=Dehalogenimonas sp. THU2 TaxID=3151121 RepID=UPI0032187F7B